MGHDRAVPDPYYGGDREFAEMFDIIDRASAASPTTCRRGSPTADPRGWNAAWARPGYRPSVQPRLAVGTCLVDLPTMSPDAQTTDHVFLPLIVRAQFVTCGLVLTASAVVAGVGAVDLGALRALFGA